MSEGFEHPWKVSPAQAVNIQKQISSRIIERPLRGPIRLVAGVDAAISPAKDKIVAAVVLLQLPEPWLGDEESAPPGPRRAGTGGVRREETPGETPGAPGLNIEPESLIPQYLDAANQVELLDNPAYWCYALSPALS